ncbi:ATP-binding protein [Streptomyces eurythermus]
MADEYVHVVDVVLPAEPSTVPLARGFVTDVLGCCSAPSLGEDVQVVVSELVTNAVTASAGGTNVSVRLRREPGRLVIEVGDQVEALPVLRRPSLANPRGYGLFLVASVSKRWGAYGDEEGKVVWSELAAA